MSGWGTGAMLRVGVGLTALGAVVLGSGLYLHHSVLPRLESARSAIDAKLDRIASARAKLGELRELKARLADASTSHPPEDTRTQHAEEGLAACERAMAEAESTLHSLRPVEPEYQRGNEAVSRSLSRMATVRTICVCSSALIGPGLVMLFGSLVIRHTSKRRSSRFWRQAPTQVAGIAMAVVGLAMLAIGLHYGLDLGNRGLGAIYESFWMKKAYLAGIAVLLFVVVPVGLTVVGLTLLTSSVARDDRDVG